MFKNKTIKFEEFPNVEDKVVLVIGASFVGAELCRQIKEMAPKDIIVFDSNEKNLASVDATRLLGSATDMDRINQIFKDLKPDVVFHTDIYTDEALLASSPCEGVKTNILGTYNVAHAAKQNHTKQFILVSTDAPNDSLRIAEKLVLGANHYKDDTTCEVYRLAGNKVTKFEDPDKISIDDFTFKLQTLVIGARTNDDNKANDYIRQILR